jgi:molybdate transport system substrate-binding protein
MIRLFALVLLIFPVTAQAEGVTVFAAASLRGALDDAAELYDGPVRLSYGGSGTLARQIASGAPADVVILANADWMDWLEGKSLLLPGSRLDLLHNALVVIAPVGTAPLADATGLRDRLGDARLAMGQRDAVPAGSYAREWLQAAGLWSALETKLAETDNVRAALALVARGETPFGIVYRTDALAEPKVAVVFDIPDDQHSPITYPAAAVTDAGRAFLAHLDSASARQIFATYGFRPATE